MSENQMTTATMSTEDVVKKLNQANGITLDMTIELMTSTNYRIRTK